MGEKLAIALTDDNRFITDEQGNVMITDEKKLENVVKKLKVLFPTERYRIYEMKLKKVI